MKLLSLFSGIGAFEKALDRENIPYELVNFCEIDKFAVKSYCAIHGVTEDKNLGDISKVADRDIPDCDIVTYGFPCVPKGSLIKTSTGYVPIENIKTGDMVLTHNNRYRKVLKTMNRESNHIYHIKGVGVHDLQITEEHPVYVLRDENFQWIKVKDLTLQDRIVYNIPDGGGKSTRLNENVLWLLGRYCADGYKENHSLYRPIFCIGKSKVAEFEEKIQGFAHTVTHQERNCVEYKITDEVLISALSDFRTGSTKKEIPQRIIDAPMEEVAIFLEGYLSGDGHRRKDRNLTMFSTISENMGLGLASLVMKVHKVVPSVGKRIDSRGENFNASYNYQFCDNAKSQQIIGDKICVQIKSIEREDSPTEVFNIEVEEDNSYTVFNVIVHNCQDLSVAGKMAGIVEGETRSGLLFEALHIIKNKKPKYAIAENVKNLVGKKFKADFDNMLNILDGYGYNSYWKVLNAKDYGIPQNRERVFVISIRKDIDDGTFKFPEKFPLELRLKDMLEETVDEKFYLTPKQIDKFQNSRKKAQEILSNNPVPRLVGGIGEINFGKQYRLGNRVYDANEIAMCLTASPVGNAGGYSYLYKVSEADTPDYETIKSVNDNYATLNGGKIGKMTDIYRRAYYDKAVSPTLHTCPGGNTEAKVIITDQQIVDSIPNSKAYIKRKAQETLDEKGYLPEFHNPYHNSEVKEISPTIATSCGNEAGVGSVLYKHNFRIRKLTPKEYWRLMGFDDSDFEKAKYRTEIKYLRGDKKCSANLKAVSEKPKPNDTATYVLCTTKDLKDMEILKTIKKSSVEMPEQEKMQNVNFVIEKLAEMERLGCAISTTKCIDFMGTHFILMEGLDRHAMVIITVVKKGKGNTVKYMKITTELNLPATKLYTILTLFVQIIQSKIFTSTTVKANIQGSIAITENSENNFLMQLSNLKMESIIEQMSNSALYKQAGNSIVVDVLQYIFRNLFGKGVNNEN